MTTRRTDIKALRKKMIDEGFYTNTSLSAASGVDRTLVGKILSGKKQPPSEAMFRLAAALNMSDQEAVSIFFAKS